MKLADLATGSDWIVWIVFAIFAVLSIILLSGYGSWFISGYNTASNEEKEKMGEFILYYRGKIVGGIYDDRLLVKPVKSAVRYMPTAPYELPYDGAKRMLLVEEVDNKKFLTGLFDAMYAELLASKQKRGK